MHFKFDSIVSDCGEPVPPANGSVISNDISHATIGCNEGYHENTAGKSVVSCLASGLWEESFQCHIGWGLIILYFDLHQQFFLNLILKKIFQNQISKISQYVQNIILIILPQTVERLMYRLM